MSTPTGCFGAQDLVLCSLGWGLRLLVQLATRARVMALTLMEARPGCGLE
jgi:hypothetical protein